MDGYSYAALVRLARLFWCRRNRKSGGALAEVLLQPSNICILTLEYSRRKYLSAWRCPLPRIHALRNDAALPVRVRQNSQNCGGNLTDVGRLGYRHFKTGMDCCGNRW